MNLVQCIISCHYLRQGGHVLVVVRLSVCLLATLRKNYWTELHEILRVGWQWATERMIKFWWRSRTGGGTNIATLVRRALAEVGTAPVLLVLRATEEFHAVLSPARRNRSWRRHWR